MNYERWYFHDVSEHRGQCPADQALGVEGSYTPEVQRWAVKLAALLPYQQGEELLTELAGIALSDSSLWRCVQRMGQRAETYLAAQSEQQTALPNPDQISPGIARTDTALGVSLDGAKFNVREEGWKEAKIGCVFHFAANGAWHLRDDGDRTDVVQASAISYVFHLGPPEPFGQRLWAEADRRGWLAARRSVVLGDGATWIWNLAALHFGDATHIVDWYHAKQHLWEAARLRYGSESPQAAAFVTRHEDNLYHGRVERIARAILAPARSAPRDSFQRAAAYFTTNRARMNYAHFQQAKLPMGSGTVESGCKQFKARFAAAGMRWSRNGAIHLMPFRAAIMSQQFDQLWRAICH